MTNTCPSVCRCCPSGRERLTFCPWTCYAPSASRGVRCWRRSSMSSRQGRGVSTLPLSSRLLRRSALHWWSLFCNRHIDNQFVGSSEIMFPWTIGLSHIAQCHLGQSEDWIICVSLALYTCNVWRNMLSRICRSIEHHFKCSVNTILK